MQMPKEKLMPFKRNHLQQPHPFNAKEICTCNIFFKKKYRENKNLELHN